VVVATTGELVTVVEGIVVEMDVGGAVESASVTAVSSAVVVTISR
jgi:hypothetical protein